MSAPHDGGDRDARPSPSAEIILLTLFAIDPDAAHHLRDLSRASELLAMQPAELAEHLEELRMLGMIVPGPEEHTLQLSVPARAHFLEMAEAVLSDNMLLQRTLQEQAEALIILRLQEGLPAPEEPGRSAAPTTPPDPAIAG